MDQKKYFLKIEQSINKNKKHKGDGHRGRLRDKFLKSGINSLHDYEVLELILTLGTPRRDCKQEAKEAIKEFGSLKKVLDASLDEIQKIKGIGPKNAFGIKFFQEISKISYKEEINNRELFSSPEVVAKYLQKYIGRNKKEYFVVLYLNARNRLIVDDVSIGVLDSSLVHPREVFKNAIQANAARIILAHNHPSDDPEPSSEDIALTRQLDEAAKIIGIELLDHIIVTKDRFVSLKEKKLI